MTLEAQSRVHEKVAGGVLVQFLTLTFFFFFCGVVRADLCNKK